MQTQLFAMTERIDKAEERISDIEDKVMENNEAEKKRERKILDHEGRLKELSDSTKYNIHILGVSEEEERVKRTESLFEEIIAENFPNMGEKTDIQIEEAQRTPMKTNTMIHCSKICKI